MKLTFLITAGPTREYLDPVRFLSNASSGRMGFALARAAREKGHRVILVSGPVDLAPPRSVTMISVVSADEMFRAVKKNIAKAHIFIGAAAVADYRPAGVSRHKIKKTGKRLNLGLLPTVDILAWSGARKKDRVLVGFALESKNVLAAARAKLRQKNLDLIVANTPASINRPRTSAWLIDGNGSTAAFRDRCKEELSENIVDEAVRIWESRHSA